ncbi:MAG: hypothetical protein KBC81_03665 [Candidatus Pacebacteria bacterium]|nr:hypothetical protein [Candidatus Paceibacterota bacterium]
MKTVKDLTWGIGFLTGIKLNALPESDRSEIIADAQKLGEQLLEDAKGLLKTSSLPVALCGLPAEMVLSSEAERLFDALVAKKEEVFARCANEQQTGNG